MLADDLVEIAFELAQRDVGRPKSASLRRSASTAYYAVFHALAALCADQLIGWREPWAVFVPVYRSLDHSRARTVLNGMRQLGPKGSPIHVIAVAFVTLQDARHEADYNPEPFRNRSGTIELVNMAREAITKIADLSRDEKLALAVKLVIKQR